MPHNRWHTGRPSARPRPFMGGMYGGEEEFDLPALFAASAQMGNLPPEIAANAISSAVQQIAASPSSPFQDYEFDIPAMPSPRPAPTPAPAPAPMPGPGMGMIPGMGGGPAPMDMAPPPPGPGMGMIPGMGGGPAPMDMPAPMSMPAPSEPVLTPEQMREIGLRSLQQKTGIGEVPFDPMSEVGPMGQEMLQGVPSPMNPRYDMYPSSGAMEYPVNQALALRANMPDPATIRNLMQIAPTGLGFAGEPAGFRGTVPGQAAVSPQMAELESGSFPQGGLGTMTDVGGMQGELGAFGTGGGSLRQGITGPITDRWLRSRDPQFEEFFDESVRGTSAAQAPVNEAAVAANKKLAQVTQAVMDNPEAKEEGVTYSQAQAAAKKILADDPQGVTSTTTVIRKLNEVKQEGLRGQGPGQVTGPGEGIPDFRTISAEQAPLTAAEQRRADAIAAAGPGGGFPGTGGPLDVSTAEPSTKEEKDAIQKAAEETVRQQKAADAAAVSTGISRTDTTVTPHVPSAEEEREAAANGLMWSGTGWVPIPPPPTYPAATTEVISEAAKKAADAAAAGNGAKFTGYPVSSSVDIDPTTNLPFGQDTAAGANLPAGGAGGMSLYDYSRDPFSQFKQWRMEQYPGASLGSLAAGERALTSGYQPAWGRYLLGATQPGTFEGFGMGTPGSEFGDYLRGGERRNLQDVRTSYQGLGDYLTALGAGGGDMTGITSPYLSVFGSDPTKQREDILSATQAAMGMRPGLGERQRRNLGSVYDIMESQYGPKAGGMFSQWVGSSFA